MNIHPQTKTKTLFWKTELWDRDRSSLSHFLPSPLDIIQSSDSIFGYLLFHYVKNWGDCILVWVCFSSLHLWTIRGIVKSNGKLSLELLEEALLNCTMVIPVDISMMASILHSDIFFSLGKQVKARKVSWYFSGSENWLVDKPQVEASHSFHSPSFLSTEMIQDDLEDICNSYFKKLKFQSAFQDHLRLYITEFQINPVNFVPLTKLTVLQVEAPGPSQVCCFPSPFSQDLSQYSHPVNLA